MVKGALYLIEDNEPAYRKELETTPYGQLIYPQIGEVILWGVSRYVVVDVAWSLALDYVTVSAEKQVPIVAIPSNNS